MAETFDAIADEHAKFIAAQPMFFVATAPRADEGHINLSPKGLDTLRVLSPTRIAYLDLTGSGNETSSHLAENGRIVVMLCSFDATARILRLYGRGRTVLPGDAEWTELRARFGEFPGVRQIILVDVARVQTSCGYAVPRMTFDEQRDTLLRWAEGRGEEGIAEYQTKKNATSIDGLAAPLGARANRSRS